MDEKRPETDESQEKTEVATVESDKRSTGSFDEQLFEKAINEDPFQKELSEAIEQRNLREFIETHSNFEGLYEFDKAVIENEIKVNDVLYKHRAKQPTKDDEVRKEAMSVQIKKSAGKVDGDDAVSNINDNGHALKKYYDSTATEIWGYPVAEGDEPEVWVAVSTVVEPADTLSQDDRELYHVGEGKDLTVLHLIPEADKLKVASMIHAGLCVVIHEKGRRIRSLRSKREYIVKQVFGVKREDDGSLSKPKHVAAYHFAEAGAKAISKFEGYAIPSRIVIKPEALNEEHRTISIPTTDALFDAHITYIQGASIEGKEVLDIQAGDARLAKIPSACKRDAGVVFFNFLKS